MSKNLVPVLTAFLIILVLFVVLQIINIVNKDPIPEATQKQIEKLDPVLNEEILEEIRAKSGG